MAQHEGARICAPHSVVFAPSPRCPICVYYAGRSSNGMRALRDHALGHVLMSGVWLALNVLTCTLHRSVLFSVYGVRHLHASATALYGAVCASFVMRCVWVCAIICARLSLV